MNLTHLYSLVTFPVYIYVVTYSKASSKHSLSISSHATFLCIVSPKRHSQLFDANMFISVLLGEGKLVFTREEMDSGFQSALLILSLHHAVNHNRTVRMSLSEQRAVMCCVTEGETRFPFPRLWSQEKMSKQRATACTFFS